MDYVRRPIKANKRSPLNCLIVGYSVAYFKSDTTNKRRFWWGRLSHRHAKKCRYCQILSNTWSAPHTVELTWTW